MVRRAPITARLHEISLQSSAPQALQNFYATALGYFPQTDAMGTVGVGPARRLRIVSGRDKQIDYAAYGVPDINELVGLHQRLEAAGVAVETSSRPGFLGETLRFVGPDDNVFVFGIAEPCMLALEEDRPARLQHIVYASTNPQTFVDFFTKIVGFVASDIVVDDERTTTTFMRSSEDHHSIAVFAAPTDRLDHFCHETTDWNMIRDWGDHLAKLHIPIQWGPGRHGPGNNLFAFIHDPDGNWVELSAELERVEPDRPLGTWPHAERTLNSWGKGYLRI